ncbi:MAG: HEAT repeat domain-containing protein [Acidimicrobiia bacterium]|nr:HEAT repeat domain-containing protein [Acidimicrobiia bacterium]
MSAADAAAVVASPLDHLGDPDAAIRRLAVSLLAGRVAETDITDRLLALLADDPDGAVRAEAAEILGAVQAAVVVQALLASCGDEDPRVVEAAITALGEQPPAAAIVATVTAAAIDGGADKLVREAAVAALGSLADPASVPVLLDLLVAGPPQIRRRAVVALTVFDHPAIEPALRAAATDRNPMVREVAEMVVGHQRHDAGAGSLEPPG